MVKKFFYAIKKSEQADPVTFWISLSSAIIGSTALLLSVVKSFL